MKRFCYEVLIFFGILLLINGILFIFAKKQYYNVYEQFPPKEYSSFIFADSHGLPIAYYSEKYDFYNFSASSESYFDMERKITYLLNNGYNVKQIILTADDHTLSPYRELSNNLDRSTIYTSPDDFNNNYEFFKQKYIKYYLPIFQPKVSSIIKSFLSVKLNIFQQANKKAENDIPWHQLQKKERLKRAQSRMDSQFPGELKSTNLENSLLGIIQLCKENNIELIGLKFPLTDSYLEVLGDKSYHADNYFILEDLNVKDYKTFFKDSPEYFSNQDHLNDKGGKVFTDQLFNYQKMK